MKFVVTGTGRSGTGYAAHLFTAAGITCGHEVVFTDKPALGEIGAPRRGRLSRAKAPAGRVKESLRRRRLDLDGDASWMAVPRLAAFDGVSYLQLRHPLLVVRSFVGTHFFSDPAPHRQQWSYAAVHFDVRGDDVTDAMRWWVFWNQLASRDASMVYHLERLDTELFADILGRLGVPNPVAVSEAAIERVPTDVNSSQQRGDSRGQLAWSDLPAGHDKDLLEQAALSWGYDPADPSHLPQPVSPDRQSRR